MAPVITSAVKNDDPGGALTPGFAFVLQKILETLGDYFVHVKANVFMALEGVLATLG